MSVHWRSTDGAIRPRAALAAGLLALGLAAGLAGCGSDERTIVTDEGTISVDAGEGKVEIEASDGSVTISGETGGDLPEGWPAEIVLPEGGTITSAVAVSGEDAGWNVSVTYEGLDPEALGEQVANSLESAGLESKGGFTSAEGALSSFEGNGYAVSVILGPEGSGSTMVMTVAKQ